MTHTFRELVVSGVLFAPFVTYAITVLVVILISRPVLRFTASLGLRTCSVMHRSLNSVST
jgi:hypothetical protein